MSETEIDLIIAVAKGITGGTGFAVGSLVYLLLLDVIILVFSILDHREMKRYHRGVLQKLEDGNIRSLHQGEKNSLSVEKEGV